MFVVPVCHQHPLLSFPSSRIHIQVGLTKHACLYSPSCCCSVLPCSNPVWHEHSTWLFFVWADKYFFWCHDYTPIWPIKRRHDFTPANYMTQGTEPTCIKSRNSSLSEIKKVKEQLKVWCTIRKHTQSSTPVCVTGTAEAKFLKTPRLHQNVNTTALISVNLDSRLPWSEFYMTWIKI